MIKKPFMTKEEVQDLWKAHDENIKENYPEEW